jgi:cytoskeleton protein RodZ
MSEVQAQAGGPGARLGAARRQQGLHIAALAAQLKVPVARLEALEAERWSELPDATHARALATSVCRVLNLDAAAVLAGMPRATGAALERVSAGLNQPVRDGAGWRAPRARLWAGAVLLLVLAAALALWPRDRGLGEWVGAWTEGLSSGQAAERSVVPTASSQPTPPTLPSPTDSPVAADPSGAANPSAVPPAGSEAAPFMPAGTANASNPASALAAPSAVISPPGGVTLTPHGVARLDIEAHAGASWISVVDAKGISQAARMLTQGERFTLEQPEAPLRLVLGNAPALRLSWRGQPQALDAHTAARVARLELK